MQNLLFICLIILCCPAWAAEDLNTKFDQAYNEQMAGHYEAAKILYQKALLQCTPAHANTLKPKILYNLAQTCMSQLDLVGAQRFLSMVEELKPRQTAVPTDLVDTMQADIYMQQRKFAEAEKVDELLIKRTQNEVTRIGAQLWLGIEQTNLKEYKQAETTLSIVLRNAPAINAPLTRQHIMSDAYCRLGDVHMKTGQFAVAEKDYRNAIKLKDKNEFSDPKFANALGDTLRAHNNLASLENDLGNAVRAQKKYDEALAIFSEALESGNKEKQERIDFLTNTATVYFDESKYQKAEDLYNQALSLAEEPPATLHDVPEIIADLASVYCKTQRLDLGRQKFDEAMAFAKKIGRKSAVLPIENKKREFLESKNYQNAK